MNPFQCKETMPPKDNSPDVVRVAQTRPEAQRNLSPACGYGMLVIGSGMDAMDVKNVQRPRFGHSY